MEAWSKAAAAAGLKKRKKTEGIFSKVQVLVNQGVRSKS
jgi:hypothetical protein